MTIHNAYINFKYYLVSSLIAITLLLTSLNGLAQQSQVAIYPYEDKDVSVITVLHEEELAMTLSIENLEGDILYYSEKSDDVRDYSNYFDFSFIEDGYYNLVVRTENEKIEQLFEVSDGLAGMEIKNNVIEPFFTEDNEDMILSYLNFDHVPMEILIYDKEEDLVFSRELGREEAFSSVFNIEKLKPGEYEVLFLAGDDAYSFLLDK
jgi:hypothetical protein